MTSIEQLDIIIKNTMNMLDENDINGTRKLMALIDERFNINDTIDQFNTRLRTSVANNFYKGFLREKHIIAFNQWKSNLDNLPLNASRYDIFSAGPEEALHVVGL
jgi:hypothetical protein